MFKKILRIHFSVYLENPVYIVKDVTVAFPMNVKLLLWTMYIYIIKKRIRMLIRHDILFFQTVLEYIVYFKYISVKNKYPNVAWTYIKLKWLNSDKCYWNICVKCIHPILQNVVLPLNLVN